MNGKQQKKINLGENKKAEQVLKNWGYKDANFMVIEGGCQ